MATERRLYPSLAGLRALEALDRLGSATDVAYEMALTQSAVSRQFQALEAQLGTALIQRDNRRLSLTPAAQAYVARIRPALEQIAQASVQLQVTPTGGTINLAILPTFGMRWLVPRLPEFARLHGDLTLNMTTRFSTFNFASEPFDAAIHFGHGDWPGTEKMLLRYEQVLPVCAPDLLARYSPRSAEDVLRMPLLHIQTRPQFWADWFVAQGMEPTSPAPGTLYDQFSTIMQAALHGLGVALVPDYLAQEDIATGNLKVAFGRAVQANGDYYLIWPTAKSADPALRQFRDWLATQAEPEDTLPR